MSAQSKGSVPKPERKRMALELLAESDLALPARAIYINLVIRGATFSYKTVYRHLKESLDEGLVENPPEKEDYYRITEKGRKWLRHDG